MDDATNPETEVEELPAEEIEQDDAEIELDEDGNPIAEPEEPEDEADDLEDVEIGGKTYKVPKDAALRHADYTRKTQALAERDREVTATLERLQAVSQEETQALANFAIVAAQLKQYENVDWDAWEEQDAQLGTREANKHWRIFQQLKQQQDEASQRYNQANEAKRSISQQETAKRMEEADRIAAQQIPGWNQEKAKATLDFSRSTYDLTNDDLLSAISERPGIIKLLHDAMIGHEAQKQATAKQKIEKLQAIKPAVTVKGGASVIKGLDDRLSAEEWARRRNQQVANRNK